MEPTYWNRLSPNSLLGGHLSKFDTENDILNAFECFDTEGKGVMDTDDLKAVLETEGSIKFNDREVG